MAQFSNFIFAMPKHLRDNKQVAVGRAGELAGRKSSVKLQPLSGCFIVLTISAFYRSMAQDLPNDKMRGMK